MSFSQFGRGWLAIRKLNQETGPDESPATVSARGSQSGNLVHRPWHREGEDVP